MLAVTTRNKLRSRRFFPPMIYASWQVRRQLARTSGIVRFTSGIAGLAEFYTLTIWESKTAMFQFTASGNHRQMMWLFSRWSDSFWSMRWLPTADEAGCWDDLHLGVAEPAIERPNDNPAWLARSQVAEALVPHIDVAGRPDKRELDPTTCGVTAVLAHIPTHSPATRIRLHEIMQHYQGLAALLRSTIVKTFDGYLLFSLWQEQATDKARVFMEKLTCGHNHAWVMRFAPGNYEIGNWDGLKLRSLARHRKVNEQ